MKDRRSGMRMKTRLRVVCGVTAQAAVPPESAPSTGASKRGSAVPAVHASTGASDASGTYVVTLMTHESGGANHIHFLEPDEAVHLAESLLACARRAHRSNEARALHGEEEDRWDGEGGANVSAGSSR